MPADLINDMIPFLGILDDAIVLAFLIYITSKMIPDSVMDKEKIEYVEENKKELKSTFFSTKKPGLTWHRLFSKFYISIFKLCNSS